MLHFCHSYYSFRFGTLSPETLVEMAVSKGISELLLADINVSMGIPDFVKACREQNIRALAGIEFRNRDQWLYTGLARNHEGLYHLNEFLTLHNEEKRSFPIDPPELPHTFFVKPFRAAATSSLKKHEYVAVRAEELNTLRVSGSPWPAERLLAYCPVTFSDTEGFRLHMNLRAIDHNTLISKLEPSMLAGTEEFMLDDAALFKLFAGHEELMENTKQFALQCDLQMDLQGVKNRKTFTGTAADDRKLLEKLTYDGLEYRYGKKNKEALKRVTHELEIIDRLGFSAYFLITWDVIRYSMSRGFYHVGRGSGANSIVAYCLRITDVDPIELDLYFERFLNPRRSSPPDFDIDYSWKERDEVIDYIFKRYGRRYTALLGATSTFRDRSAYRELGKVYGLPKEEIDQLTEHPEACAAQDPICAQIHRVAQQMADFPNVRSIHAGGILISEKPVTYYSALDMPPKGFPTTQWDMYVAEEIGYEKLDILSQRGIGHIKECAQIVSENHGVDIDVHDVKRFKKDRKVRDLLRSGETLGCFYIESPAMRSLIRKLRCEDYLTLVAASSIIRPGVARSGMMREYIHRFHHPDQFEYLHPIMKEQLSETFGVMVYQEDVLKVCHHFAGLDLADADVLRRAMSGKFRGHKELRRIIDKFMSNCRERGYPEEITNEVWRQIDSFAGYSFSKAHSASYAVESYQSLFLKAYYPVDFMVAVINNFGGFYRSWVYFNEARRWGGIIHLPCVNHSRYNSSLKGKDIYIGLVHIAGLESRIAHDIPEERKRGGEYLSMEDLLSRIDISLEQLFILVKCGALRFTGLSKAQLMWQVHLHLAKRKPNPHVFTLFQTPAKKYSLPVLIHNPLEDAYDEIELLGFPVSCTWFDLLKTAFRGDIPATQLNQHLGKKVRMVGHLVCLKYIRTIKKEMMHFGTFVDVNGEFFDTVHFPDSLKNYPFRGYGTYLILGTVVEEFGYASVQAEKLARLPIKSDPRAE
jgi:DNA polymerase-3 subunit alpha